MNTLENATLYSETSSDAASVEKYATGRESLLQPLSIVELFTDILEERIRPDRRTAKQENPVQIERRCGARRYTDVVKKQNCNYL